ncbi:sensor histidine kinase [Streptomyces paludis]|uniref:Two-component sensor histidine kinase n=1 Tax=Streptomyces paludis TaxID=2282738 RepID=A0A345HTJ3_9ACTN|nr:histidine kinase [Streptomyces paludis]AXG80017.1 two-component sensor histidine kinase [Streptomyces paludis]
MAQKTLTLTGGNTSEVPRSAVTAPSRLPPLPIQVNALQALCRQTFGFRLAMIALAAPFALARTSSPLGTWLVSASVLVTFMVSYVLLRDWERFGPILLRHPALLAADMSFGALLLVTASPDSTLAYVTICTPLLAGLVYGWRGAAVFAVLQSLIVAAAYAVNPDAKAGFTALLLPGLCVIAGAIGSTLRNLMLGFGAASQALTEARARLAVAGAVEEERARLAREMHDSVAKTLHGLAMAADGLAGSAGRLDPGTVKRQAELVARSARRAAAESRELLSDLRRESGLDGGVDVLAELASRTNDFARRHGVEATFRQIGNASVPPLPHAVARHALTIATEAMENAQRHARPNYVNVAAGIVGDVLRISVYDDGPGLPPGTTLDDLRRAGHFGLVGMVERAASIGARIRIGRGRAARGTEVRLDLPAVVLATTGAEPAGAPLLT